MLSSPTLHGQHGLRPVLCYFFLAAGQTWIVTEEAAGSSHLVLVITSLVWPCLCLKVNLQVLMQKSVSFMVEAMNRRVFLQEKARRAIKTTVLANFCVFCPDQQCILWHCTPWRDQTGLLLWMVFLCAHQDITTVPIRLHTCSMLLYLHLPRSTGIVYWTNLLPLTRLRQTQKIMPCLNSQHSSLFML